MRMVLPASAALLLSCAALDAGRGRASFEGRRVAIVGGGLAGLACAYELRSIGYEVTIVEARKRVGGRVVSLRDLVPGGVVEGGGEFIGANHPVWLAYADRFGLRLIETEDPDAAAGPVVLQGRVLPAERAKALFEELDEAFARMTTDARPIDADEPWRSADARRLDRMSALDWLRSLQLSELGRAAMTVELLDNGVRLADQSYLGHLAQVKGGGLEHYWTDSEAFRCADGNDALAFRLAAAIGQHNIRTGVAAVRVRVGARGVDVLCSDRSLLVADDVVLAVPPSVWDAIAFEPPLPGGLRPQMGMSVKHLAHVPQAFWSDAGLGPDALSDGPINRTWEAPCDPTVGGAAVASFSSGPPVAEMRRRWAADGDDAYRAELARMFPGAPVKFLSASFQDWVGEGWTRAGYSFPAPGELTTVAPLLRQGLGRLHFTGEHACFKFPGYMEGALDAGVALARRLAQRDAIAEQQVRDASERAATDAGS